MKTKQFSFLFGSFLFIILCSLSLIGWVSADENSTAPICGNNICEQGELFSEDGSCAMNCYPDTGCTQLCGEDFCPSDCGFSAICGDGICQEFEKFHPSFPGQETDYYCASDCYPSPPINDSCECQGCLEKNKCYPIGYRKLVSYCSDKGFKKQILDNKACFNNFECKSNLCLANKCVKQSLLNQIINLVNRYKK